MYPRVRSVSPPPPPPFNLEVYQELVAMDPHGFQMVRSRLEDIFPRLSDVATSSIGASVGGLIAEENIGAPALTKAYLATHGMTPDGLGARVIQSKHTGRWRGSCKELWNLLDDRQKAASGRSSSSYPNNPHYSDPAYDSPYDRNLLLYAMLEIKLSLDKDSLADVEYSTLTLFDTICGSGVGGYQVPTTNAPTRDTYEVQDGYEIDTFAPIVNYGSLETLRSAYMSSLSSCSTAFALEDMALHAFCNMQDRFGSQRSYLRLETTQRAHFSPFTMHRDRLCSASYEISIEDVLAKLPQHTNALYDTPERNKFKVDYWVVPVWARGEEQISARTLELSMRSFVYITSSNDPSVRPGMHRLIDLPVFGNTQCGLLPGANCAPPGLNIPVRSTPTELATYESSASHITGRKLLSRVRCSQIIRVATGQDVCDRRPYVSSGMGCYSDDLVFLSRPVLYSSRQWMRSLVAPPPSPPPYSPSPPPPNPLPPSPMPPPAPPYIQSQTELMAAIRDLEEQACTSVYYLTTTTRCERLAVGLTQSVLYQTLDPPSPPPAQPTVDSPPLPTYPASPSMPSGISSTPISSAVLSTVRVPIVPSARRLNLYNDGYYMTQLELDTARASMSTTSQGQLVRCTPWQSSGPLPCVSGAMEANCISGLRHCGSDAENSLQPVLELYFSGAPSTRRNRLWGFEVELPQNEELASLFFHSSENIGGSGYQVEVFRVDGSPVPCQPQSAQVGALALTSDRKVKHVCATGGSSDADLYALMDATRIRIVLTGSYRQIWIKSVSVFEMSIESASLPPRPPRPPPRPRLPPSPPSTPHASCTFNSGWFLQNNVIVVFDEPCGLTKQECCDMARAYESLVHVDAFEIDDSGCCKLLQSTDTSTSVESQLFNYSRIGYLSVSSGTGIVVYDDVPVLLPSPPPPKEFSPSPPPPRD